MGQEWRTILLEVGTAILWLVIGISIGWRHGRANIAKDVLSWIEHIEKKNK